MENKIATSEKIMKLSDDDIRVWTWRFIFGACGLMWFALISVLIHITK